MGDTTMPFKFWSSFRLFVLKVYFQVISWIRN